MPRDPLQLLLFRFDPEAGPSPQPRPKRRRHAKAKRRHRRPPVQLRLELIPPSACGTPAGDADDDTEYDYPTHRMIAATEAPPIKPTAPRSVFDLAAGMDLPTLRRMSASLKAHGRTGHDPVFSPASASASPAKISTANGARIVGAQYPANRWTPEREEQERIRRAKQKPPKPKASARKRSKALMEAIGNNVWED
jgi:hypothetical protein